MVKTKLLAKYEAEAKAAGLTLIGSGKDKDYRNYRIWACKHVQQIRLDHVRTGGFKCHQCLQVKLETEALAAGLTLLGPGKNNNKRNYRFNKCGHERDIQTTQVRNGNVRCEPCFNNKLEAEAVATGLTLLGPGKDSRYRNYRFNECGHEEEMQTGGVRTGGFKCQQCFQEKLWAEAVEAGLTLIGSGKSASYRNYRFNDCGHEDNIQTSAVRKNQFRCQQCFNEKLEAEASSAGLTLLGSGKNHDYRNYRFNKCGHKQDINTSQVRNGNPECAVCFRERLEAEAAEAGLTIIGPGTRDSYRNYRFNECGHEREINLLSVRTGSPRCTVCLNKRLETEASNIGLTLIGDGKDSRYRSYRFNKCGHEQDIQTGDVRHGNPQCELCFNNKLKAEAKARDLTVIGPGKDSGYRKYRFDNCGHKDEIRTDQVRAGYLVCHMCEETAHDLPSSVYLLKIKVDSVEWLKLGYSKSIDTRVTEYGLPDNAQIIAVSTRPFDTGRKARKFEESIHIKYKKKRLSPRRLKQFHSLSGFEECYPVGMLETLTSELNR